MQELNEMFNRQRKYIVYVIGVYVLGVIFTKYDQIFQGLILGTISSLFMFWSMVQKNKKFSKAVSEGKKTGSLGTATRMSIGALATVIALRYPNEFHIGSMVLGLMTVYIVIMIDYLIQHLRR